MADIEFVSIEIHRHSDGLFMACSPELTGVCVTHRDLALIKEDIPNIVKLWYKRQRGSDVEVYLQPATNVDGHYSVNLVSIPAHMAAEQLGR